MLQKTNYKAVFDFLSLYIHTLGMGVLQELDTELFLDKILEDLLFTDSLLSRLFQKLRDNPYLNRRWEYLSMLEKTKEEYLRLISNLKKNNRILTEPLDAYWPSLASCYEGQTAELHQLQLLLTEIKKNPIPHEGEAITDLEYQFLFEKEDSQEYEKFSRKDPNSSK